MSGSGQVSISSPWVAIPESVLSRASRELTLSGNSMTLRAGKRFVRFSKYGNAWCLVDEGEGDIGYIGSCMRAQQATKTILEILQQQATAVGQMELFA